MDDDALVKHCTDMFAGGNGSDDRDRIAEAMIAGAAIYLAARHGSHRAAERLYAVADMMAVDGINYLPGTPS